MLGGDAKPTRAPRETRKRNSVAKERVERDEEDLVRLYLEDIGRYPLLTKDDEVRLAQAVERGREAAAELDSGAKLTPARKRELRKLAAAGKQAHLDFVNANLRLVVSLAKRYQATDLLSYASTPASLHSPIGDEGDSELADIVADPNAVSPFDEVAKALLPDEIDRLLRPLDDREREILRLRYGLDRGDARTLDE